MLIWGRSTAEPCVIRDIDEKFCSPSNKLTSEVREDPFVTNEHGELFVCQREHSWYRSRYEISDAFDQFVEKKEKAAVERDIFTKRGEFYLIVRPKDLSLSRN